MLRPAIVAWGALLALFALSGCMHAHTKRTEGAIDGNSTNFFSERDLARLPPPEQEAWRRYLGRSDELRAWDRASMNAELRAEKQESMTPAPFRKAFNIETRMTAEWFHGTEAAELADSMLSYQTPSGGWSKHVEYSAGPRKRGVSYYSENAGWYYIATIDNDTTTEQIAFLAQAYAARSEPRYLAALLKGLDYLLEAQYPNGCWPQVYPLQGGYHDAATYNDNAIINVIRLLNDVGNGVYPFVPSETEARASRAALHGIDCIVASQVIVRGVRTVWAQQEHPISFEPVSARSYELASLCGRESAKVTEYLMTVPSPDARVVEAVHASVDWFKKHAIYGIEYESQVAKRVDGAGPLWARLYEIATDKPIFANRDGVKRYDWNELTDRRKGYTWYTKEPTRLLERYQAWAPEHPRR